MIKNYLKIAFRNLYKNKLYSGLNIAGLAIGIACCILIMLYVQNELSYDRFHTKADRIYRVATHFEVKDRIMNFATTAHVQGSMFKADYPEVEDFVTFDDYGSRRIVRYKNKTFFEEKFLWVTNSIFEVFSFNLVKGNPQDALVKPNTVVITEEMAEKYFGDEEPIGKNLRIHNDTLYMVTGVMENVPQTSHIRPDFFASFSTLNLKPSGNAAQDLLNNVDYYTYVLLRADADYKQLEKKFESFVDKHIGALLKSLGGKAKIELQPLTDIYLYSDKENELERTSDITYVYLFSGIGLFILLIACLNFINLSTARSANRAKEVGLRKVVGAQRPQLIKQFIGESMLLTFIAIGIALVLVTLSLPIFQNLSGKELALNYFSNPQLLAGLLLFFVVVSLIGGSYPAFFLSAFRPVEVLQGRHRRGTKKAAMRIALVSLQFTVSIVLIIATLIVNQQLNYVHAKKLGYDKDHVVALRVRNPGTRKKHEAIRNELLRNPNILAVSASSSLPLGQNSFSAHHAEGKPQDELFMLFSQIVDENYIDTYQMEIVKGRNFSQEFPSDFKEGIIINEAAAVKLGWQDAPLGKGIERFTSINTKRKYRIIGVVRDYHFQSLREEIQPLVLYTNASFGGTFNRISIRIRPERVQETIEFIKSKWKEFDSQYPIEYVFVDSQYDSLYRTEERLEQIFGYFTILAIVIGCLGLFGLTSFSAEQRTKEIGIRKVLGASISGIILLLVREFTKWILLAVVIAWPLGYYVMSMWLQNFHYRIGLKIEIFLLAAVFALIIAVLTVSYQAVRAAIANPVKSLRYE